MHETAMLGAASLAGTSVIAIVLMILQIVAYWRIFEKAGEQGWKSLIPVYSDYVMYKLAWDARIFWVNIVLAILYSILGLIPGIGVFFAFLAIVLVLIIEVLFLVKLAKAFGHGRRFAVGLLLLSPIFILILGFDRSEYIGPQA